MNNGPIHRISSEAAAALALVGLPAPEPAPSRLTLHINAGLALDARELRLVADAAQAAAEQRIALLLETRRRDAELRRRNG